MLLERLLLGTDVQSTKGNLNICITNLHSDSRQIREGGLFVAIKGESLDGADFVEDALNHGAVAVLVSDESADSLHWLPEGYPVIVARDVRKVMAQIAANLYDHPEKKVSIVGVTGTKGKTTTTFMLKKILEKSGKKVGLVGTIAAFAGEERICDTDRTTPESFELLRLMAQMVELGVEIVILEVSSQAMKLSRVYGFPFQVAVFTNFSEDHISPKEHASMEEYFGCKEKLLLQAKYAVLNADDETVATLLSKVGNPVSFGFTAKDVRAEKESLQLSPSKASFVLQANEEIFPVTVSIPGVFSVYNAMAAIAAATCFGASREAIVEALADITVLGRCELVPNDLGITIMIDYAHTPASLESILKTVREYCAGKLICAWGVGGDRDRKKRPIMGEISGKYADYTVLMSDQVRTEEPMQILKDIEVGILKTGAPYTIIEDRTEGIEFALGKARPGDFVLIPGLGHDMYLERDGVKYPYDERGVIAKAITKLQAK